MKIIHILFTSILFFGLENSLHATLGSEKITLMPSMEIKYEQLPSSVDSLEDIFNEGIFYGRLRTNTFLWNWNDEGRFDNKALGIGASIVYKTAPLNGFSTTLGLYTSQNPAWFRESESDLGNVKAGKDTFSRYKTTTSGDFGMTVLGQAYLEYKSQKNSIKTGRQMLESVYTRSNDTKMIPNTFDGITFVTKELPHTIISFSYLAKQKLRDHTTSHDVIAFSGGSTPNKWTNNDDAGVNKNLTVSRIGDNNKLLTTSVNNKSIKNLNATLSYFIVPDVISNASLEAHYLIPLSNKWKLVPGFRYMQQFDNLNANYGVANLATNQSGYTNANSLDTSLLALRVDMKTKAFLARLGYSHIADKADIVTPWRGFPTGGFTRAMAQYNWYANTKTYMARLDYDFSKAGIVEGLSIMTRYAIQDFDDSKAGVQGDTNILHIDIRQNIGRNLEAKIRLGFVENKDTSAKTDVSYNEYRFELNYFF